MENPIRILLLEDMQEDAELIRAHLENSTLDFKFHHVTDRKGYEEALSKKPDVILSDYSLPDFNAPDAFRLMIVSGFKVPFIVVTGVLKDADTADLMRSGIDDYLLKDRLARLPFAIKRQMGLHQARTRIFEQEKLVDTTSSRYRTITDNSDDLVTIVDPFGVYVFVSAASRKMLGMAPEELIGRSGFDLIAPQDLERLSIEHQRMFDTLETITIDHHIVAADGSHVPVESCASPVINNSTGELNEIIVITRDVSEKVKTRKRLERTKFLLSEAQHLAHLGNWNLDLLTEELYWSSSMKEIIGVSTDFTPDYDYFVSMIHDDDRAEVMTKVGKSEETGMGFETHFRLIRPDGIERVMKVKTNVDKGRDGRVVRLYGILQDVTELKNAQNRLEQTLKELEQRVEERTQELKNKNRDIVDSIRYAERLVNASLPSQKIFDRYFQEQFIFNRPLNIIGGDFYWCHRAGKQIMVSCVDCTGHGVSGAIMSLMGTDLLNHIVASNEWTFPSLILELLDTELENRLNQDGSEQISDGMDMSFCAINKRERKLLFCGAMNPIVIVGDDGLRVFKGNRYSLGAYISSSEKSFETTEVEYKRGDMLYMFSDGFQDQFGGPNNKRFMFKRLKLLFQEIHELPAKEQHEVIIEKFNDWKGDIGQTDDVLLMGLRLG